MKLYGLTNECYIGRQLEHVREVQNAINGHDFVGKVLPHIARRNEALVREVLSFISGMLFNANRDVQVRLYYIFVYELQI